MGGFRGSSSSRSGSKKMEYKKITEVEVKCSSGSSSRSSGTVAVAAGGVEVAGAVVHVVGLVVIVVVVVVVVVVVRLMKKSWITPNKEYTKIPIV